MGVLPRPSRLRKVLHGCKSEDDRGRQRHLFEVTAAVGGSLVFMALLGCAPELSAASWMFEWEGQIHVFTIGIYSYGGVGGTMNNSNRRGL